MPPPSETVRPRRPKRWLQAVLTLLLIGGTAACEGNRFGIMWRPAIDEVFLYSLDRPELNLPTGFDFRGRRQIDIAATDKGRDWDVAVGTRDGVMVFLPPGALGIASEARVAVVPGTELEDVVIAPEDLESYVSDEPIPLNIGDTYVIRSRRQSDFFGFSCIYYAKATPIQLSPEVEYIRIRFETNPFCNDPRLRPTG